MVDKVTSYRVVQALAICSALVVIFYFVGIIVYGSWATWYLLANMALAYIPLGLTYPLCGLLRKRVLNVQTVLLGGLWLGFLPNSFYLVTDVTHLVDTDHGLPALFGVILFGLFAFLGVTVGFISLKAVHLSLIPLLKRRSAYLLVELVILLSSVAIYLGKVLRWNTWDLVVHPVGVAQGVVQALINPGYGGFTMILMFFVLLTGLYAAVWRVWGAK